MQQIEPGDLCEASYVELSPSITINSESGAWEWGHGLIKDDDGTLGICIAVLNDRVDEIWCAFLVTPVGLGWDLRENWDIDGKH